MTAHKNAAYVSRVPHPIMHTAIVGNSLARFFHRLRGMGEGLAQRREKTSCIAATFTMGNEHYTGGGYAHISANETARDHAINIQTINLLEPRVR